MGKFSINTLSALGIFRQHQKKIVFLCFALGMGKLSEDEDEDEGQGQDQDQVI